MSGLVTLLSPVLQLELRFGGLHYSADALELWGEGGDVSGSLIQEGSKQYEVTGLSCSPF